MLTPWRVQIESYTKDDSLRTIMISMSYPQAAIYNSCYTTWFRIPAHAHCICHKNFITRPMPKFFYFGEIASALKNLYDYSIIGRCMHGTPCTCSYGSLSHELYDWEHLHNQEYAQARPHYVYICLVIHVGPISTHRSYNQVVVICCLHPLLWHTQLRIEAITHTVCVNWKYGPLNLDHNLPICNRAGWGAELF